jgi:hypothetical protein
MLLVFDDAHRDKGVELKIMNFGSSYALPEGMIVTHTEPWAGTAACHEDGYLTGVHSLLAPPRQPPPPRRGLQRR